MIKRDEIDYSESCFNKARDDERLFILLARDPAAPAAIRAWVNERIRLGKNAPDDAQVVEALDCADRMERERVANHSCGCLPFQVDAASQAQDVEDAQHDVFQHVEAP